MALRGNLTLYQQKGMVPRLTERDKTPWQQFGYNYLNHKNLNDLNLNIISSKSMTAPRGIDREPSFSTMGATTGVTALAALRGKRTRHLHHNTADTLREGACCAIERMSKITLIIWAKRHLADS